MRNSVLRLQEWQENLFSKTMKLYRDVETKAGTLIEPQGHRRFDLFSPFIDCPDGNRPVRFGASGDGGKLICEDILSGPDCIVYSLGSHGDFSFEMEIIKRTSCRVVTFDCTVDAKPFDQRHTFVKKCLGSHERMQANAGEWTTLTAAMQALGHTKIDLLKIDIEGSEYDVMEGWKKTDKLPRQVSIEIHYSGIYYGTSSYKNASDTSNLLWPLHEMKLSDLALFMVHLSQVGYGIVSREDNELAHHCSELTLLNVF